ncbi:hypothetical protein FS837_001601, partial [Tulasnella sp. UAMH 9824]
HEALNGQVSLTEQQWTRFDTHTKLIKEFKVETQGRDVNTLRALQTVWAQRPSGLSRPFTPSIEHLTVVLPGSYWALGSAEEWTPLFSDTLLSFHLTYRGAIWESEDDTGTNLTHCLDALRTTSPHLQRMTLQVSARLALAEPCFQAVVGTIRALNKLRYLGLDFTPSLPAWLAYDVLSTNHLDRVYLGAVVSDDHQAEAPKARTIPHTLTDIGLSGATPPMAGLLKAIDPSKVRRVVVKDSALQEWGSSVTPAETLFDALNRFPNLRQLELDLSISSFDTLLQLHNQLQGLISFTIGPSSSSTSWISERTLSQLADLLPRIEELQIVGDGLDRESVSLNTLQCFATSCPHLRKLRIPILIANYKGTDIQSHPSVQEIDFRSSIILRPVDIGAAAENISAMFPNLLSLSYVGEDDFDMDSDDSNAWAWDDLAEALVRLLPGLIVSVSDDNEQTIGSFGDLFSDAVN